MTELSRDLESVFDGKNKYYGGNQQWSEKSLIQKNGCGVVGAAQVIIHERCRQNPKASINKADFLGLVEELRKKYLFVLPFFGLGGIPLCWGINRYFSRYGMDMRARWGVFPWNYWKRVEEMLENDIPVLFAAGPNFPNPAGKHSISLYDKNRTGYYTVTHTNAHYMTITAMDDSWIRVSSWGRKYYINKNEYMTYVRKHSNWLFSNMLYIRKTNKCSNNYRH